MRIISIVVHKIYAVVARSVKVIILFRRWELLVPVEWEVPEEWWETSLKGCQKLFVWKLAKSKWQANRGEDQIGLCILPPRRSNTPAVGCNLTGMGGGTISHTGPLLFLFLHSFVVFSILGYQQDCVTNATKSTTSKETKVPLSLHTPMSTATVIIHPN